MDLAAPTVIVARRVKQDRLAEFAVWNDRLLRAAADFSGNLASESQPPDAAHPDEWVNIYRFERQQDLDDWLVSAERAAMLTEGSDLFDGPVREQRIAPSEPNPNVVTAVMSKRIRAGAEDAYRQAHVDITHAMSQFDGFIRSEVSEPVPGVQPEHITIFSFSSREQLDAWISSDERHAQLERLDTLVEGPATLNVVGGFAGWFRRPESREAPRWKQALTVLIALYPTTLTLGFLQRNLWPDVPWIPALLVSNVLGIMVLTWFLMPQITHRLDAWLHRDD